MWKWIVGGVVVLIVVLAGTCWYGYRKLISGGDSTTVAIAAKPDRVFASLADPDSMVLWMAGGSKVTASRHGVLVVGDTLHIETRTPGRPNPQDFTWMVSEVVPAHLLVLQMQSDSSGNVFATRRDSLVAAGDSTLIVSTIASPMMDSIRAERGDTGGRMRGALYDMSSKLLISAFRVVSEQELRQLKARIEGSPPR